MVLIESVVLVVTLAGLRLVNNWILVFILLILFFQGDEILQIIFGILLSSLVLVAAIFDVSHGLDVLGIVNGLSFLHRLFVFFTLLRSFGLLSIVLLGVVTAKAHIT